MDTSRLRDLFINATDTANAYSIRVFDQMFREGFYGQALVPMICNRITTNNRTDWFESDNEVYYIVASSGFYSPLLSLMVFQMNNGMSSDTTCHWLNPAQIEIVRAEKETWMMLQTHHKRSLTTLTSV